MDGTTIDALARLRGKTIADARVVERDGSVALETTDGLVVAFSPEHARRGGRRRIYWRLRLRLR